MKIKDARVFIASPFFTEEQLEILKPVEELLKSKVKGFFSARLMNKIEPNQVHAEIDSMTTFRLNCEAMDEYDLMINIPKDKDLGTVFECGYAFKSGKPIIYYAPFLTKDQPFNLMLACSGINVVYSMEELEEYLDSILELEVEELKTKLTHELIQ